MEASTTIKQMLAGNRIFVPTYQEHILGTPNLEKSNPPKQIKRFPLRFRRL